MTSENLLCRFDPNEPDDTFERLLSLAKEETCPHIRRGIGRVQPLDLIVAMDAGCLQEIEDRHCNKENKGKLRLIAQQTFKTRRDRGSIVASTIHSLNPSLVTFPGAPSPGDKIDAPRLVVAPVYRKAERLNIDKASVAVVMHANTEDRGAPMEVSATISDITGDEVGTLVATISVTVPAASANHHKMATNSDSPERREEVEERKLDDFVQSANAITRSRGFIDWAGDERVTLAIVFTDIVGATATGEEIKDESMSEVRRAHFDQSRGLIARFKGREIKTMGDSFMVAFRSVELAFDYARMLQSNPGHPKVKIRAGIHIGAMHVEESDVFGSTVNFAARVVGAIKDAEIWLSKPAKEDIDRLGAARHAELKWNQHEVTMKGFPEASYTLWSLVP